MWCPCMITSVRRVYLVIPATFGGCGVAGPSLSRPGCVERRFRCVVSCVRLVWPFLSLATGLRDLKAGFSAILDAHRVLWGDRKVSDRNDYGVENNRFPSAGADC